MIFFNHIHIKLFYQQENNKKNKKNFAKPLANHKKIWYNNDVYLYLEEKFYEKLYGQGFSA